MIAKGSGIEWQMVCLDTLVTLHGATGLIGSFTDNQVTRNTTFPQDYPELFYLLVIYMVGAVCVPIIKTSRYYYLFSYLPKKL